MTDALEVLREAGGYLGSTSLGIVGYVLKRFKNTESRAKVAHTKVLALEEELGELKKAIATLRDVTTVLRAELGRVDTARLETEREVGDFVKGEADQWRALQRSLGQIEGKLATLTKT